VHIQVEIKTKYLRGVIAGAGSAHWARDLEFTGGRDSLAFTIVEHNDSRDESEWTHHKVTHLQVASALSKLAAVAPHHFSSLIEQNDDMWTGDAILQVACFGELKYG
jgi:hypothetical protein